MKDGCLGLASLMLLSKRIPAYPVDEDGLANLVEMEVKLMDDLIESRGDANSALWKLNVLVARLRADNHDECEEGLQNLRLLMSAIQDFAPSCLATGPTRG